MEELAAFAIQLGSQQAELRDQQRGLAAQLQSAVRALQQHQGERATTEGKWEWGVCGLRGIESKVRAGFSPSD